jgi:hypothetical protein
MPSVGSDGFEYTRRMRDVRLSNLKRALEGDAWHGPSLEDALAGVDAARAAAHPIANAHSIWEIVLHVSGWTREVAKRLRGGEPTTPAAGDWPSPGLLDEEAWSKALAELRSVHEELVSALLAFRRSGFPRRSALGGARLSGRASRTSR